MSVYFMCCVCVSVCVCVCACIWCVCSTVLRRTRDISVKIFLFYEHQRRNSLLIEIISVRCGNPAPAKKQNCFTSIVHYNINPRVGINKGV